MKIIQIMPQFHLAGAEIMCENLTYGLQKLGHQVIVVSLFDYHSSITDHMEEAGVDVRYLGKRPGLDVSMIGKLQKLFRQEKPDVIHTHLYTMQYAIPAAILAGVKNRVHTLHNVAEKENKPTARKLNRVFYKHFGVIPIALSELVQETVVQEYGLPKEKVPVIYNGISLEKCMPKTSYAAEDTIRLLHIGRFSQQKNHAGLLQAFKKVHAQYPNCRLQLIGEGETWEETEALAAQLQLADAVDFLGVQNNVFPFLHDADLFVLPSIYEGIPITLIEAMGTGVPIVASAVGGVPDMIEDGKEGLLCTSEPEDVAEKILQMLADPALRQCCGQAAAAGATRFSADTMAKNYDKIYQHKG